MDPIGWLVETRPFMDRWHCIRGDVGLGQMMLWANGVTALAYLALGLPLVKLYRAHRRGFGAAWLLAGFASFIVLCGVHHAFYDLAFRYPAYRAFAVNDVLMAAFSAVVASATWMASDMLCKVRPLSEVLAERDAKEAAWRGEALARADAEAQGLQYHEKYLAALNQLNEAQIRIEAYASRYDRDRMYSEIRQTVAEIAETLRGGTATTGGSRDGD